MRRDLILGIVFSIVFHGGIAWVGELTKEGPKKVKIVKDDTPAIEMKMPDIPPDEPDKVETEEMQAAPVEFAPPMQADVPQIVQVDSFVQQIQPPPPEGLKPSTNAIVIPQGARGFSTKGMEVFDISKLDQQPQPKFQAKPQYPFEMRRAGIAGEVVVDFIVTAAGDVINAYAARSSQREFEAAAVQAVSKWKFRPGKKGGRAVNTHMQVPIVFTLNDE